MSKIAVLLGTARANSVSGKVAGFVVEVFREHGFELSFIKPEEHLKALQTARVGTEIPENQWSKIMSEANGLVIVSPEYNHGYPGELKLMLDELYDEYLGKPVLICGVSDGELGGARMVENLVPVLVTLGMYPLRRGVYFARADKMIDSTGKFNGEPMRGQLEKSIDKFKQYLANLGKT